ncbi:hypothetical protein Plhal304r1_c034g0106171 [Plasmopara halstedii]
MTAFVNFEPLPVPFASTLRLILRVLDSRYWVLFLNTGALALSSAEEQELDKAVYFCRGSLFNFTSLVCAIFGLSTKCQKTRGTYHHSQLCVT